MELITLCKTLNLATPGSKLELLKRTETFLTTEIKTGATSNRVNVIAIQVWKIVKT